MKPFEECLDEESKKALVNGANLIMTGGEPMMNQDKVVEFIKWVRENLNANTWVEVETNGTIPVTMDTQTEVSQFNCSPKLSNSGNDKNIRYNKVVLEQLNQLNTQFKFVISSKEDWKEVQEDFAFIDKAKIWLMPAGENQELLNETKQVVAELAKENYLKYTNRLHIEIWNQKTGV
jgi:organic radical activating enzyme